MALASYFAEQARRRQIMEDARAIFLSEQLQKSAEIVDAAIRARRLAVREFDAAGGVPDETDPNLRD